MTFKKEKSPNCGLLLHNDYYNGWRLWTWNVVKKKKKKFFFENTYLLQMKILIEIKSSQIYYHYLYHVSIFPFFFFFFSILIWSFDCDRILVHNCVRRDILDSSHLKTVQSRWVECGFYQSWLSSIKLTSVKWL